MIRRTRFPFQPNCARNFQPIRHVGFDRRETCQPARWWCYLASSKNSRVLDAFFWWTRVPCEYQYAEYTFKSVECCLAKRLTPHTASRSLKTNESILLCRAQHIAYLHFYHVDWISSLGMHQIWNHAALSQPRDLNGSDKSAARRKKKNTVFSHTPRSLRARRLWESSSCTKRAADVCTHRVYMKNPLRARWRVSVQRTI